MALTLVTAPTTEPVSLAEAKAHLRVDSTDFADDITATQTIAPGSHAIAAAYSLQGVSVDALGFSSLALLESGTNGGGGTVDVKLQDSANATTWADVSGGAFTQVTTANDNATYEKPYTGGRQYLRAVSTVAGAACEFGVTVLKDAPTSAEDNLISDLITAAREDAETFLNRALITQTWDCFLSEWPREDYIDLPLPRLQSVASIKHKDTAGSESTWAASNYIVDTDSEPGRVVLAYGKNWPSTTLYPSNGIAVRFVAGYGAASAVPKSIKQGLLLDIGHLFENREAVVIGPPARELPLGVRRLYYPHRVFF